MKNYILFQILPKVVPDDAIENKINTASDNDLVPNMRHTIA